MLIKNLRPFQQWSNMKNILLREENSNDFFRSLVKCLKVKFLHPMRRSMRMLSFKMRNFKEMKNDIFDQQSWGFFQSSAFRSIRPKLFYKKVSEVKIILKNSQETPVAESFFNAVENLTFLNIDSGTRVFL